MKGLSITHSLSQNNPQDLLFLSNDKKMIGVCSDFGLVDSKIRVLLLLLVDHLLYSSISKLAVGQASEDHLPIFTFGQICVKWIE